MSAYETLACHGWFEAAREVARREIHSEQTVTFLAEVDLTDVEMARARARLAGEVRPTYTAFVAKALAMALKEFPYANRRFYRPWGMPFLPLRFQQFHGGDVAVACERDVPGVEAAAFIDVLRDADRMSLAEIGDWLRRLAASDETGNRQWRDYRWLMTRFPRRLAAFLIHLAAFFPSLWARYRGGSAVISSPAKYGVDAVIGSWPAPIGISFGLAKPRAVVRGGKVVARPTFALTLNFDRHVMAGAPAAKFFNRIVELLERAETELAGRKPVDDRAFERRAVAHRGPAARN